MVTCLSGMPALESLNQFLLPSGPDQWERQRPPVVTRTVLPVVTPLDFQGVHKYLEEFVAQIDTTHANLSIMFPRPRISHPTPLPFHQLCRKSQTVQSGLCGFLGRERLPQLRTAKWFQVGDLAQQPTRADLIDGGALS